MPTVRPDATLTGAVDVARAAAEEIADPGAVGPHVGVRMEAERLATHLFDCTAPAYRGWTWAVTVTRVARSRSVTICETHLLPGDGALLAPEWVPYAQRLTGDDVGPGDVLPIVVDDPRLEPGFEATGDEDVDAMALWELGLGRHRVLSAQGRQEAAQRWYDGDHGPTAEAATKASAACSTCGFYVPTAGILRRLFGVCANVCSPSDGRIVALDHGCGAHSETDVQAGRPAAVGEPILDEFAWDELSRDELADDRA